MSKKKTVALSAAGIMAAAAVAVSGAGGTPTTVSEPAAQTEVYQDGTFAGSQNALVEAVNRLVDKSRERGMDIPSQTETYTPGINGVISGLDGMAPTDGETMEVKVSKEGTLYDRDKVRMCKEFSVGDQVRIATGGAKIIATARSMVGSLADKTEDYTSRIAVLFTQDGETKLKTVDMGSEMLLGTTVTILDEELKTASMAMDGWNKCYIAYNQDGDGMLTTVKLGKDRTNTVADTDLWMDGGDPENICLAVEPQYGEAAVCCTRLPASSIEDADREAVLIDMTLHAGGSESGIAELGEEIVLTAAAQPALYGIEYSVDQYTSGWDMEYAHYWHEEYADKRCSSLFITFPSADDNRRGIIYVKRSHNAYSGKCEGASEVMGYEMTQVYGALPTVSLNRVCTGEQLGNAAGVAMASGVTKLFNQYGYSSTRSRVEVELYTVTRDVEKPFLLSWTASDNWYNTNISNVSAGHMGEGGMYLSLVRNNSVYAAIIEFRAGGATVQGPMVNVGSCGTYSNMEMVDDDRAALIYDTAAGDAYVRILTSERVVAEADGTVADGTVLTGGRTGTMVTADITYNPDNLGKTSG